MRYIIYILIILLLFVPIKIPLKVFFENNKIEIYIFNKLIFPITKKQKKKKKRTNPNIKKQKPKNIERSSKNKEHSLKSSDYIVIGKNILIKLYNYKFKPNVKLDINIHIGTEDAMNTAMICGALYNLNPIIYQLFSILFKFSYFNFKVNPIYNKSLIKFSISSIFYISLVKIISMIIYLLIRFIKEVRLIRSG